MKKRILLMLLIVLVVVATLTGCSSAKLPDFNNMTVKELQKDALDYASDMGYELKVTNYSGETATENGKKVSSYTYEINGGYLELYIESSSDGDFIDIYLDAYEADDPYASSDEWLALVEGVLMAIDPQADWAEFDAMFIYEDFIEYHGYYYDYYYTDYTLELIIYKAY